ncbi:type-1 angiotensin II receptor-associated protein isoform X3 [Ovis canadensis]|uniref:type-1 angiotensin II receptor-associated protein isoform X3 n=1 Tax=Ovis canadensis TaxID=37174 RepID=UPI0005FB8935
MELPAVNLKAILLVHWLLTTWGCIVFQGPYAWTNFPILALGVWAVAQRDSVDAISMFLGGLVATIFLDVIYIGIFYPRSNFSDTVRFSAGFLGPSEERSSYQPIDSSEVPADPESKAHVTRGY